jgi:hypothetical protein
MAKWYVYSAAGGDQKGYGDVDRNDVTESDNWTDAFLYLDTALDSAAAGDEIYIAHDHNYNSYAANVTYTSAGTFASPVFVICVNRTSGAYATTAIEDCTGGVYDFTFIGNLIVHGVIFKSGDTIVVSTNDYLRLVDGDLELGGVSPGDGIAVSTGGLLEIINSDLTFGENSQYLSVGDGGIFIWNGGTLNGNQEELFTGISRGGRFYIRGVDLSAITGAGYRLFDGWGAVTDEAPHVEISGCKFNAANPPVIMQDTVGIEGVKIIVESCYSSGYPYSQYHYSQGDVYTATNCYQAATYDGTNGYSIKMVTTANADEYHRPIRHKLADVWCASANPTLTVELITDNVTLQNDEFWIEIEHPDATVPAYRVWDRTSRAADPRATPANLTSSSVTWTEDLGTEVKQKIAETISGGGVGIHTVWACLAKPSTTVYVCPKITVS